MQSLNAFSLAPDTRGWLANSRHPCILHVFDQACNLINEHREVLSIVIPQIGNGPFNLVVGDEVLFSEYLNIESPVSILGNQIMFGDLTINIASAEHWNPSLDWETLHGKREEILSQLLSLPIIVEHPFGTNYEPLFPHSLLTTFSTAVANADLPSALTATQKLAGLGQGLTPSGDDFIIGAIYAMWIIHPLETAKVLAEEIARTAAPLTTSLSAAWLRSAGKGEAGILWHEFFDALVSTNIMNVQESFEKILAVGETSGADAMSGFCGTIYHWVESIGVTRVTDL